MAGEYFTRVCACWGMFYNIVCLLGMIYNIVSCWAMFYNIMHLLGSIYNIVCLLGNSLQLCVSGGECFTTLCVYWRMFYNIVCLLGNVLQQFVPTG